MTGITFLCSGGGGNARMLHALARRGALPVAVSGLIADRDCPALDWARAEGIPARMVPYTRSQPGALADILEQWSPDIVVTTIHKILDDALVARYEGRLMNLHYSLLPAFGGSIGMESVRRARAHACRLVGATAHRVTSDLDAGPILAQACVPNDPDMPDEQVFDEVFRCGAVALASAIDDLVAPGSLQRGGIAHAGDTAVFASPIPRDAVCGAFRDPAFWASLR